MDWPQIDTYVREWLEEIRYQIMTSLECKLNIETKSNRNDLVTNIDKETEQFFCEKIRSHFPEHRIVGEEGYGEKLEELSGVVWIIDPIDGTVNFVHQHRNFAVSIGIYKDGVGKLAYVYDVVHDELYFASAGEGAYFNEQKLPKLDEAKVEDSIISISSSWVIKNRKTEESKLQQLVSDSRATRSLGAASLEFASVATGRLDAYITMRLAPWDFAAGKIIVEELGGVVTNLEGNDLDMLGTNAVIVAKPGLHQTIVRDYIQLK